MLRKIVLIFTMITFISIGYSLNVQTYDINLKPSNKIASYIKNFNSFLAKKGIIKKYNIKPFIDNHPIHITMYLTSYNNKNINNIENKIKNIASNTSQFNITTKDITAGKSGFVLLNIENSKSLQNTADEVVSTISQFRNKDYTMPSWVKYYPKKQLSFKKYGDPNTYTQFNPHISLFAVKLKTEKQKTEFIKDMKKAISEFKQQKLTVKVNEIALDKVNLNGQIISNIKTIKLKR